MIKNVFASCMVLSLFMQVSLYGQQYLPIFEDGKRWVVKWQAADIVENRIKEVSGDTIINGNLYRILDNNYVRQADAKVYVWNESDNQEVSLYDFDLKEGDVFCDIGEDRLMVVSVDTIEVCGVSRKRIAFIPEWYIGFYKDFYNGEYNGKDPKYWIVCWVEGIGSSNSPMDYSDWYVTGPRHTMQECYFNGECIFTYDDFFTNPVSRVAVTTHPMAESQAIYDLQGRRAQQPQRGGLYIQNGKKFIQK